MSILSVAKGAVAQVNPFDNGKTYGTYNNGVSAKPPTVPKVTPTPSYQPSNTTNGINTSAFDAQMAQSQAAINALQGQLAAQPRLPVYNTTQAWSAAQQKAQGIVDPVYVDKLNQYLAKANLDLQQQQGQTATNKAGIQTSLSQALQDNATTRQRTGEDQTTQLGDVAQTEGNYQKDEGTQFDRARQSLLGNVAQSGLTTSGLGQQQNQQAIADRNQASNEQVQQFSNQKRDINTAATRTFNDLTTSDTRAQGSAGVKSAQEDTNLKNYIDNANLDQTAFRTQNEADRLAAIAQNTQSQYNLGAANFISSLIGSGARPQDIALAQQVYGGRGQVV